MARGFSIFSPQRTSFWVHWFSLLISCFQFDFYSFIISFILLTLDLICSSVSNFLRWRLRWLILDLSSFLIYAFKAIYLAAFLSKQFSLYPTNVELCFHFHLVQAVVTIRTSLVVKWLRLHFSAVAQVLSLVGEVPQCLWIQEKQTHTHTKSQKLLFQNQTWVYSPATHQSQSTDPRLWWRKFQNTLWKDWCWNWSFNTLATWCKQLTHWKRLRC